MKERFFLVSNNNNKKNCSENNYFLKRISLNKKANKNVLYEKLKKFNLDWFEQINNDKIIIFILMEVTKCEKFKELKEIIVTDEEKALEIFLNLIIELNFLRNQSIKYNLNPDLIFIDEENNVKINLIDLALFELNEKDEKDDSNDEEEDKEEKIIDNKNINKIENIDNNIDISEEENEEGNIKIFLEKDLKDKKEIKNNQKSLNLFLGIMLSDLLSKKK